MPVLSLAICSPSRPRRVVCVVARQTLSSGFSSKTFVWFCFQIITVTLNSLLWATISLFGKFVVHVFR